MYLVQVCPGSLDQWLYFLTQRTVLNLHQIHFFLFCVNKRFRFMLVYSCLLICYLRMRKFFVLFFEVVVHTDSAVTKAILNKGRSKNAFINDVCVFVCLAYQV